MCMGFSLNRLVFEFLALKCEAGQIINDGTEKQDISGLAEHTVCLNIFQQFIDKRKIRLI